MMRMMSFSTVHGFIDLNAKCLEGDFFFSQKEKSWEDIEKLLCTVSLADNEKEKSIR